MKALLRPRILVPVVVGASLIGALLGIADARRVVGVIARFRIEYLVAFALVMVAYEAARLLQWHLLLRHLGIRTRLRAEAFAFAGGEVGRYAPMGALIQNYILAAVRHVSFSLSSAATGLAVVAEIAIAPLIVVVLGVDRWPWLRPAVGATMLAAAAFLTVMARVHATRLIERWLASGRWGAALRGGLARFLEGLSRFDDPRVLGVTALITAVYVLLGGAGLWVVAVGVGAQVTIHAALAAYSIGVTLALVVPAFTDVGTLEAGSVAALVAMGSSPQVAVAVSLLDRGLMVAASFSFGALAALLFPDLVRAVRESPRGRPSVPPRSRVPPRGRVLTPLVTLGLLASACGTSPAVSHARAPHASHAPSPLIASPSAPATLLVSTAGWRLPAPLSRESSVALAGSLWILGGLDSSGLSTAGVLRVDPRTGAVVRSASLPAATHDAGAAAIGGTVFVFRGGQSSSSDAVQSFAPGAGTAVVGHLPRPRSDLVAVADGGTALVVGGYDGARPAMSVLRTRDGMTFDAVARLALPVRYAAAAVTGGTLYVFGGSWAGAPRRAVQAVDLTSGEVRLAAMLPVGLSDAAAVVLGGEVWILGGRTPAGLSDAIFRFDPTSGTVARVGTLPAPVADASLVRWGAGAYLIGGEERPPATAAGSGSPRELGPHEVSIHCELVAEAFPMPAEVVAAS